MLKWRRFRDYSGGLLTDWGAHHFDIVQWALDKDNSGPVDILVPDGKDIKSPTIVYDNGVKVVVGGFRSDPRQPHLIFYGTKGTIWVNRVAMYTDPEYLIREPVSMSEIRLPRNAGHKQNWVDCIRSRRKPIAHEEVGCRSATVCHLLSIALWEGRSLKWDPEKEEIVDDALASRWIHRAMREPWKI
jgi:predicted dehydrogenase